MNNIICRACANAREGSGVVVFCYARGEWVNAETVRRECRDAKGASACPKEHGAQRS